MQHPVEVRGAYCAFFNAICPYAGVFVIYRIEGILWAIPNAACVGCTMQARAMGILTQYRWHQWDASKTEKTCNPPAIE